MCHKDVRCGIGLVDLALQGADAASVTFRSCQNLLASPHLPHPPPLLSTLFRRFKEEEISLAFPFPDCASYPNNLPRCK